MTDVNIGADITMTVDVSALPANVLDHVIYIGLRNTLMDSHASVTKEDHPVVAEWLAAKKAMAEKKLAAMYAGDVRTVVTSGRTSDPVKQEAIEIATRVVKAREKALGNKVDAKALRVLALAEFEKGKDAYMTRAQRVIDVRNEPMPEAVIDITELTPTA